MDKPCEWCGSTSAQIDSIEYENEQLKARIAELEALQPQWVSDINPEDGAYVLTRCANGGIFNACMFVAETDVFESLETGEDLTADVADWKYITPPAPGK